MVMFRSSVSCYPWFSENICLVQPHLAAATATLLHSVIKRSGQFPRKARKLLETLITHTNVTELVYFYPDIAIAQSLYGFVIPL